MTLPLMLIERVSRRTSGVSCNINSYKFAFGRGGMQSKMKMTKKAAYLGIHVYIANGNHENVLQDLYH